MASIDPWATLLIGALGAAVLSALAALVGSAIQRLSERKRWVREQRLDAYRGYLRVVELTWPMQSTDQQVWRDHQDAMSVAIGDIMLVGPNLAYTRALIHWNAVLDFASVQRKKNGVEDGTKRPELQPQLEAAAAAMNGARDLFVLAARKALKIKREVRLPRQA